MAWVLTKPSRCKEMTSRDLWSEFRPLFVVMTRPQGSKSGERNRTPAVKRAHKFSQTLSPLQCRAAEAVFTSLELAGEEASVELLSLVEEATTTAEVQIIRAIFGETAAAESSFKDELNEALVNGKAKCLIALDLANLRKIEATGKPIGKIADYEEYRDADAPSVSSFYNHWDSFSEALYEVGCKDIHRHMYDLSRSSGGGRRPKDYVEPPKEYWAGLYARLVEEFHGYLIGWDQWDDYRHLIALDLPRARTMAQKFEGKWPELQDLAVEIILANPEQYPRSAELYRLRRPAPAMGGRKKKKIKSGVSDQGEGNGKNT